MKTKMVFKALSVISTALGIVVPLMTGWVDDKKLDMLVEEKVAEKLAEYGRK